MLVEWLEPSIQKRIEQIRSEYEVENRPNYNRFISILSDLKDNEEVMGKLLELESLYIQKDVFIEKAYRRAVDDMMQIRI
ncbi:hypothetical protein [Paenibacillus dendritiformis]|uniref:hypothetical protein n=1 Tax=Paenibacillus dendritiformis TaxID=130049 RepID=UPI000DAA7D92|nr:hypothetical protein [Paenibacillus dendritiformis]PZM61857.1 hypothetical protein DOE73_30300 [Paenibacillus dendritiformis]